jgi:hypothetical protein
VFPAKFPRLPMIIGLAILLAACNGPVSSTSTPNVAITPLPVPATLTPHVIVTAMAARISGKLVRNGQCLQLV